MARFSRICNHACMARSTITMTLRIEPQMYERIATQAQRAGQSLNAAAVELLECALGAYEQVDVEEADLSAK